MMSGVAKRRAAGLPRQFDARTERERPLAWMKSPTRSAASTRAKPILGQGASRLEAR